MRWSDNHIYHNFETSEIFFLSARYSKIFIRKAKIDWTFQLECCHNIEVWKARTIHSLFIFGRKISCERQWVRKLSKVQNIIHPVMNMRNNITLFSKKKEIEIHQKLSFNKFQKAIWARIYKHKVFELFIQFTPFPSLFNLYINQDLLFN